MESAGGGASNGVGFSPSGTIWDVILACKAKVSLKFRNASKFRNLIVGFELLSQWIFGIYPVHGKHDSGKSMRKVIYLTLIQDFGSNTSLIGLII